MRRKIIISSFILICGISNAQEPSQEAEAFFTKAMTSINPRHVEWIKTTATTANRNNHTDAGIKAEAVNYGKLNNLSDMDIEALAFLVMMEAAKSAREDLKAIMDNVKSINQQKQKMRELQGQFHNIKNPTTQQTDSFRRAATSIQAVQTKTNPRLVAGPTQTIKKDSTIRIQRMQTIQASKSDIDNAKETIKNKLDSMSEMGETESLRLQMAMDRMSKMMSTLSNIMKKISDTANQIVQNLK